MRATIQVFLYEPIFKEVGSKFGWLEASGESPERDVLPVGCTSAPAPSPRFAVNGAPEWTPRHSTELCVRLIMRVGEARERGEGRGLQADGLDVCQKTCVCEDGWGALA